MPKNSKLPKVQPGHRNFRRILILGHSGFIGSRLESCFRAKLPNVEIVGRSFPDLDLTIEADVESLRDVFERDTVVIMCAAIKRQVGENLEAFSQNVKMIVNLCRLLEDRPVGRFIFFSSAAVYGEDVQNTNITEETPVCPTSFYGIAKYTCECLLRKTIQPGTGSELLVLRPATVYGADEPVKSYGPSGFVKAAFLGEPITLWGDGKEQREFVFVDDLIELTLHLAFHEWQGTLNIVTGVSRSFLDAIAILSKFGVCSVRTTSRPRTKRHVDQRYSNRALTKLFPEFTFTDLEEGMRKILAAESRMSHSREWNVELKGT